MFKLFCILMLCASQQVFAGFENLKKIEIEELTFKEIIRSLYEGQLTQGKITEIDYEDGESFSLYDKNQKRKDIENSTLLKKPKKLDKLENHYMHSEQEMYGAYLGDIRRYYNSKNEERFLVGIVIVGLTDDWGIAERRPQEALLDLYIFKKKGNLFQLISRTSEDIKPTGNVGVPAGVFWDTLYDEKQYQYPVVKLGKDLVGILSESTVSLGVGDPFHSYWNVIRLNEDDYITIDYIEGGAEDTFQDESSPTHFAYQASYSIYNDNSPNFPIFVRYRGDIPQYDPDGNFITVKKDDYSIKWIFTKEKGYIKTNISN